MPGPLVAAAVTAGGNMLSQGINAVTQGSMNKKTRKWQEKMYNQQRQDALADWTLQNDYNHPTAQMQRLKEAGLNPNLVYGNGATTESGAVRSSNPGNWNPEAVKFDMGGASRDGLSAYFEAQMKEQTVNNLKAQMNAINEDVNLKKAQTYATYASAALSEGHTSMNAFDLDMKRRLQSNSMEMANYSLEALKANINKTNADTNYTLTQREIQVAIKESTIQKAVQEVLNLKANNKQAEAVTARTYDERKKINAEIQEIRTRISQIGQDARIKKLDADLKETGAQPHDKVWWRYLQQAIKGWVEGNNAPDKK